MIDKVGTKCFHPGSTNTSAKISERYPHGRGRRAPSSGDEAYATTAFAANGERLQG